MTSGGTTAAFFRPRTVGEAVDILGTARAAGRPTDLLAGGTDLVPALRTGERRPACLVALRRVLELRVRGAGADTLTVGAGVTYTDLTGWSLAPGLALTARVVGSAQIRNVGTVGGALGSARPTGDLLTFLTAADAEILVASPAGPGTMTLPAYLAGGLPADGLVTAVRLPRPSGPQLYLKIGGRQAAYQALVSCAVLVDRVRHRVTCALGGIGRQPIRAVAAERFAAAEVDWSAGVASAPAARRFGELVSEAAAQAEPALPPGPRVSADYRWHAAGVLGARAFARCLRAADPSAGWTTGAATAPDTGAATAPAIGPTAAPTTDPAVGPTAEADVTRTGPTAGPTVDRTPGRARDIVPEPPG